MARILVVDDSPVDRENLGRILSGFGHTILNAADGVEGIAMAKANRPDIIFMDIVMGEDMNGFEATRILAKETQETAGIPIILCTSKGQKTDQAWGKAQGAVAHVTKPARQDNIKAALVEIGRA